MNGASGGSGPAETALAEGTRPRGACRPWLGTVLRDFHWVHLGLGLSGNTLFVVGSVMFFWAGVQTLAIWLFVVGSLGMLTGSAPARGRLSGSGDPGVAGGHEEGRSPISG